MIELPPTLCRVTSADPTGSTNMQFIAMFTLDGDVIETVERVARINPLLRTFPKWLHERPYASQSRWSQHLPNLLDQLRNHIIVCEDRIRSVLDNNANLPLLWCFAPVENMPDPTLGLPPLRLLRPFGDYVFSVRVNLSVEARYDDYGAVIAEHREGADFITRIVRERLG
jgi:hypothetical protein